jgi:hypothetical protein
MPQTEWRASRHDPIQPLNEHLWRIEAPLPGMPLRRVMTVARRGDGDLVVHSAIGLDEASMEKLEAWGKLAYLVVPNGFHRMAAPMYKARYPRITVVCPAGARGRVHKVVDVDMTYEQFPSDDVVSLSYLDGVRRSEGVLSVRAPDGVTLVMNDALFNCPHLPGLPGFALRHITASTGFPRVSRLFKLAAMRDKPALRACFERLAETPDLRRIVVSHHLTIDDDPAGALREAARNL